ncbi:hypothetical protein EV421DRAFT_2000351, partial [Armillaria borealis]
MGAGISRQLMQFGLLAVNESYPAATMRSPTSSSKQSKKPIPNSNSSLSASIELVKGAVAVGEMLPVAGSFVKGLAGAAVVFLENLERFEKNKEDVQVLARDITEVVIIVRDAGIKISAEPESLEYMADLKNACAEFQKFLSDLTTQVIDIERSNLGLWKDIKKLLTSRDVQEKVNRYRQVMEGTRSNLLLSLNLISSTSISRITHGVAALQSSQTDLTTITSDIQRHIKARSSADNKCRDTWSTQKIHRVVDGDLIQVGEAIKYAADVSTSSRVFVVKEYSGSAGLQEWERDFHVHSTAPRHPNLRQLYGVVKSEESPCLVFHGKADEIPFYKFPTLFDKELRPLVLYCYCNELNLRCAPDGHLVFDEVHRFCWADTWDRIYVNDFEDIVDPVSPAVQWSLKLLMLQRQEPTISKELLSSYYRIMTVGAPWCMVPDVDMDIVDSTLLGAFIVSDLQERHHFIVDCLGEGIPPVKLSIQSYATGELLEVRGGLWRFLRTQSPIEENEGLLGTLIPEFNEVFNFLGLGFTCSMELTSDARSQHLASWFSQGPRILAKISESLKDAYHPDLVVSHNSHLPGIPYVFIDLPFMRHDAKDHSITLPEIYLSTDPRGAKQGADCAWRNIYKLEVIDMGDSGLFVSRVNLEMACRLQERCGLRTASLDTARFLNQMELTFQMIIDEAITNVLSEYINPSVCDNEEDCPVTWDKLKEYSMLMKSYDESEPSAERDRDVSSGDEVDQSLKAESNQNINAGGPQSLIVASTLLRTVLIIAFLVYISSLRNIPPENDTILSPSGYMVFFTSLPGQVEE